MAVTRTGSATSIANTNQTWSQSVNVPADAQVAVVIATVWANQDNWIAANPFSLGGSNLTTLQKTDSQHDNNATWLGYLVNPPTGSQTLSCNWGQSLPAGASITIAFFVGVDTSNPIRSSGQQTSNGSDLTGLTASAGDMMVGGVGSDTQPTVTDNSQTQLTNAAGGGLYLGSAQKDGATGFYFTGGAYTTCVALVLRQASGGSTSITVTDTASGSDAVPSVAVALTLAESGHGSDSLPGTTASLPLADSGAGTDALSQLTAGLALSDSGSGVDGLAQLLAGLLMSDSLAGSETIGIMAGMLLDDTGSGAETADIAASLVVSDSGSGSDAISLLQELLKSIIDSGSGSDAIGGIQVSLSLSDNGAGAEAMTISAQIAVADQGAADDLVNLLTSTLAQIFDSGSGSDSVSVSVDVISLADAGAGSDDLAAAVNLVITDTSTGLELINILQTTLILVSDLGAGEDAIDRVDVSLKVDDSGSAVETVAQILATLMVTDMGSGVDVALHFDLSTRIFKIVFTMARPVLAFVLSTCGIEFNLAQPSVGFALFQEA